MIWLGVIWLSAACRADFTVAVLPIATPTTSAVISPPRATLSDPTPMINFPTPAPQATPTVPPTPSPITLTLVYDNRSFDARLTTDWGLASVIEDGPTTVLFDTGGTGAILLDNLRLLEVEVRRIDAIVLSHSHRDHTDGLSALLAAITPTLYAPSAVLRILPRSVRDRVRLIDTDQPTAITARLQTTGVLGASIPEQALIIKTAQGLSVITGCAHPGIVEIVRQARQWGPIDLIVGGFHLLDASPTQVANVIEELQALGVRRVAPTHCTGEPTIAQFRAAFADNFIEAGAGAVIVLAP